MEIDVSLGWGESIASVIDQRLEESLPTEDFEGFECFEGTCREREHDEEDQTVGDELRSL